MVGEKPSCLDMVVAMCEGKRLVGSIREGEVVTGDVVCFVRDGEEPCFTIAKDSDRVVMYHEGREKFVFKSVLTREGYRFLGGIRLGQ